MNSQDNAPSSARDPAMAPAPEAAAAAEPGPLAPRERRLVQALAVAASLALHAYPHRVWCQSEQPHPCCREHVAAS